MTYYVDILKIKTYNSHKTSFYTHKTKKEGGLFKENLKWERDETKKFN